MNQSTTLAVVGGDVRQAYLAELLHAAGHTLSLIHISMCIRDSLSMLDLLPNELSRTDKEILYLRYQLNLNCVDIAEYLHISHEASRARLSRAKQHYAHLLAKERLM